MEPWKFQLSMSRKQDEKALYSGAIMTDIALESKTYLNLNVNESIIEVSFLFFSFFFFVFWQKVQ